MQQGAVVTLASAKAGKGPAGRLVGRRKRKPKAIAVVSDACTGCAGAPVCQVFCPVEDCMILEPADDAYPFGRIWVDPLKCVGCRACLASGQMGCFVAGCPWDAIAMVPIEQWEREHGELPY